MCRKNFTLFYVSMLAMLLPETAAGITSIEHIDPIAPVIFGVTGILFVAIVGRYTARRLGLPSVMGGLSMGVVIGNVLQGQSLELVCIKDLIMPLEVILLSIGLFISAVIGKLVAGFGASTRLNRMAIGAGMLPRGEVGLVFAAIGKSVGVIDDAMFSAIVLMVILTTLMSPPLLKRALKSEAKQTPE